MSEAMAWMYGRSDLKLTRFSFYHGFVLFDEVLWKFIYFYILRHVILALIHDTSFALLHEWIIRKNRISNTKSGEIFPIYCILIVEN